MHNENDFAYQVTRVQPLSEQVSQFFLSPEKMPGLIYAAGQYISVIHHDGRISYLSIACAPRIDNQLEFHVFHPSENALAQDLLHQAQTDKRWLLEGPFGECTADKLQTQRPIIFLARGTGFAPIKAVIEALTNQKNSPPIYLYWFIPQETHFYLVDLLEAWEKKLTNFSYDLLADQVYGEVSFKRIAEQHKDFSNTFVYASGSMQFVHTAFAALQPHGLQRELFMSDV